MAEVEAFTAYLEEQSALTEDVGVESMEDRPGAREMSDKWIDAEALLAEEATIWEAFVQEAGRTPWRYQDPAQRALALTIGQSAVCLNERCMSGMCDSQWPVCGRCRMHKLPCEWPEDFHPEALPDHGFSE